MANPNVKRAAKRPRTTLGTTPTEPRLLLVVGHERAIMPQQPTGSGRTCSCWVPPVVALARFYGLEQLHNTTTSVSVESILALRPGDQDEEVCEVLEQAFGVWPAPSSWSNDETFFDGNDVALSGPTSEEDFGTHKVAEAWFADVQKTINAGNLVLLLVERLFGTKDKGNTHYLLCLGCEEIPRRRGGHAYSLRIKDPMEGNALLTAQLWEEPEVELMTRQLTGQPLDRYTILESTHLHGLGGLLAGTAATNTANTGATAATGAKSATNKEGARSHSKES